MHPDYEDAEEAARQLLTPWVGKVFIKISFKSVSYMILPSQSLGLRHLPRSANLTDGEAEGGGSFSAILKWRFKLDEKIGAR